MGKSEFSSLLLTGSDGGLQVIENGGPGRDRTDDLFHAMEARSQLRHRPTKGKIVPILSERVEIVNV